MRIRRILCLVLCMVLCVPLFAACANSGALDPDTDDEGNKKPFTIDVSGAGYTLAGSSFKALRTGTIPKALAAATVKPEGDAPDDAIPTDAAFILTTASATDEAEIKKHISIYPAVDYKVEKQSDTVYRLTPEQPLDEGAVYSIGVGGEGQPAVLRFAFQTETKFKLKSTLPADLAVGVPVNTGIELRFTKPVDGKSIGDFIKVEPEIKYTIKFYPDGKTVVLIPDDYLAVNTVYTVTVDAELAAVSGETLESGTALKFRTEAEPTTTADGRVYISPEANELIFGTSQTPVYKWWVYTSEGQEIKEEDAQVKIWRYPSAQVLADAVKKMAESRADIYFSGEEFKYPTDGLEKVADYTSPITALENNQYSRKNYIELRTEGRGFYLCEVTLIVKSSGEPVTRTFQVIVQVTDLRLYTEASEGSLLLWVQGAGGLDVSGTSVTAELFSAPDDFRWNVDPKETVYTPATAKAGKDGICYIDTGENDFAYIIVQKGSDALFRAASLYSYDTAKSYFATVFTDREVYFADDTVNFHGYLRPTRGGELPKRITMETSVGTKVSLPVNADGSFSGKYTLEDFYGWGVNFSFTDADGNSVANKYIRVTQEEKPVYTATLSFDRPAYNFGEDATLTLTASFFDGTPAPGLKFELNFNYFASGVVTLVTDEEGKATYTLKTGAVNAYSTYPTSLYCSAQLTGYEGTSLYLNANALYFHSDVHFAYKHVDEDNGNGHILVTLDKFDGEKIAALTTGDDIYGKDFPQNLLAGPAEGSVSVTLAESWYEEIPTGTVYDPISKTTSKTYRYEKREKMLDSYTAKFALGKLKLAYVESDSDHWLYYTVTYKDSRGRNTYSFTINARDGSEWYGPYVQDRKYYELEYDSSPKSVGDKTEFTLKYGGEPVDGGRLLYTVYSDSRDIVAVTGENKFSLEYKADYIAGMQLFAVYFDGSDFAYTGGANLSYDYQKNSSLELEITPDRDTYKPGETATVTVRVIDTATGKPVTSGGVTLAVVDEACFALGEQNVDPAAEFYGYIRVIPYVCRNVAMPLFQQPYFMGDFGGRYGAESLAGMPAPMPGANWDNAVKDAAREEAATQAAGTGNVAIRQIFSDNPLFATLNTADGTAAFTFTVPDNITKWRLTAVAESETSGEPGGVKLGAATSQTVVTLPFFVSAYANSYYIAGDEVTVSARVFGTALESGLETAYMATLTDANGKTIKTYERTAPAGTQVFFSFDKLGEGSYSLTVTAVCGEYSDGVKLTFDVIKTGVLAPVFREILPSEIGTIKPAAYPVTLTFYNSVFDEWLGAANLVMRQRSLRADSLAAYYAAGKAVIALMGGGEYLEQQLEEARDKLATYGSTTVPLLPYDTPDIELSALISAAAPEALSDSRRAMLASEFRTRLEAGADDDVEFATLYLGLAATGEPVLTDLRYIAEHCSSMSLKAQLYICAALAVTGDYASASALYAQVREKYSGTAEDGSMFFADPTDSAEDRIAGAAAALPTASLVARDDADALAKYIISRTSSLELYVLQLAAYVRAFIPADGKELTLTYATADGEEHTETLTPYGCVSLTLDKAGLAGFKVISADDGVAVRASYMDTLDEAMRNEKPTEEASLNKTVAVYDASRGLYKVKLDYKVTTDRDYSYFTLTDLIPSGGRYFYMEHSDYSSSTGYAYLYNVGQTMRGGIFVANDTGKDDALSGRRTRTITGSISYIIRVAIPGEYIAEAAFMQNLSSGCYATSARQSITLK